MQAKVLDVPPVVTDQERADEWADQLEDLLLEVGRIFPRADLRCRAATCVRGLLGPLSGKNGWQIAEHAGDSRPDGQQHLLNRACWDVDELRDVVRRYVVEGLDDDGAGLGPGGPGVLVIDDTGFPKDGDESPCVARQYSGTLGKTANCQVGVSVHLVNEGASCAADWRLFCPESWDDQALDDPVAAAGARRRRERAGIPDEVRHREKWRLALDMIEEMTGPGGWGVPAPVTAAGGSRPVVAADIGYGDNALFRQQLTAAGWRYAVAVKGSTTAHDGDAVPQARPYGRLGQPPKPAYPDPPVTLRQLALAHAGQIRPVTWRQGTRTSKDNPAAAMASCFLASRVRPASRHIPRTADRSLPACWLLAEWPPDADEPTGYWLSTLPEDTSLDELVRLAKIRWRAGHDYRELKTGLGLDHFEGRSWTGWHRHVTLAVLAQAFCTLLRTDPKAPAPG